MIDYWNEMLQTERYDAVAFNVERELEKLKPLYSARIPRERARSADEQDVIEGRQFYCYTKRAGVTAKVKRAIRRRERHNWKKELEL